MKKIGGLLISLSLPASSCATAQAGLPIKGAAALPEYCAPNGTNEADGISLVTFSNVGDPGGTRNVRCTYNSDPAKPLPKRDFFFRIMCPVGLKLAHPGFVFEGSQNADESLIALIPVAGSSGDDSIDIGVRLKSSSTPLALTITALCR